MRKALQREKRGRYAFLVIVFRTVWSTQKIVKEKERGRKIHAESVAGICCSV